MATKKASKKVKRQRGVVKLTAPQLSFIEALKGNLGIISKAADEVGMHRNTHYHWLKTNAKYAEEIAAIEDDCIDVVENALMNNILAGDVASIIFYLKTKAKKRGYVEKSEYGVTDKEGNDVKQQVIVIGGKEITF
ncbi:MAG: hypothetical protein WCH59_09195 [Chitinophagia bacterium]|jgi:hypothetical protein